MFCFLFFLGNGSKGIYIVQEVYLFQPRKYLLGGTSFEFGSASIWCLHISVPFKKIIINRLVGTHFSIRDLISWHSINCKKNFPPYTKDYPSSSHDRLYSIRYVQSKRTVFSQKAQKCSCFLNKLLSRVSTPN